MVFRFAKTLDPITLFHSPSVPSSTRVLNILKQASAAAEAETVASKRGEFQLEITTAPPTADQLRNILDYVTANPAGASQNTVQYGVGEVIRGAKDAEDAVKRFKESGEGVFVRPITVDWTNGRAVVGDNESEILKMVHQLDAN
ncbi:hypothetical protein P170DRAFT_408385 [Aspergillus terreus]|uniref:Uncharacterized protein n=1 Tax=Aspergillus terreus TaxID=33178 RepID=A0A5M3Z3E7_ASPTE|nr:hypothetical protein ATETN484_0008039300 [Aspergillus terreus]GFF21221.1 hypothetical protein P170DRAFT_408385 [Aspergillus terreus]